MIDLAINSAAVGIVMVISRRRTLYASARQSREDCSTVPLAHNSTVGTEMPKLQDSRITERVSPCRNAGYQVPLKSKQGDQL